MAAINHDDFTQDNSIAKSCRLKASSKENGRRYNCKECGKQMINQTNLNTHIRAIHEGLKYPCDQCQYRATQKGHLIQHQRSVHEGVKYSCEQCVHQATSKNILHTIEEQFMKE